MRKKTDDGGGGFFFDKSKHVLCFYFYVYIYFFSLVRGDALGRGKEMVPCILQGIPHVPSY